MRDKQNLKEWTKRNYKTLTGLRVRQPVRLYLDSMVLIVIHPTDFLYADSRKKPHQIYGTNARVHVPRSLCKRTRITISRKNGAIVTKGAMQTRQ